MTELPLFKYPSTIVWIDDDALFLKAIARTFGKYFPIKTFSSPIEAMNFMENYTPFLSTTKFLRGCIENENYDSASHMPVDLNIENLNKLFLDSERGNEISVIVVDYMMPSMDGIEVCRVLKKLPMKKILLTGEADHPRAVNAFNEGIIDRYVRKDSQDLASKMTEYIDELVGQYFYENTRLLLSHLEVDQPLPVSDSVFVTFFNKLCQEKQIKEYYLVDKYGNFRLVNEENKISYIITHTEKTLNDFVEVHKDAAWAGDLLQKVRKRELIPFFGIGKEPWEINESEWDSCLFEPYVLEGNKQRYFLTIID